MSVAEVDVVGDIDVVEAGNSVVIEDVIAWYAVLE